jgi:hypothetical protein
MPCSNEGERPGRGRKNLADSVSCRKTKVTNQKSPGGAKDKSLRVREFHDDGNSWQENGVDREAALLALEWNARIQRRDHGFAYRTMLGE